MFGSDGATAIAPIDPVGWSSKIGVHVRAGVGRFPDAAVHGADIEHVRLGWNACGGLRPAASERSDVPPGQFLKEFRSRSPVERVGRATVARVARRLTASKNGATDSSAGLTCDPAPVLRIQLAAMGECPGKLSPWRLHSMRRTVFVASMALVVLAAVVRAGQTPSGADRLTAERFETMAIRNIGPALVTGRVVDIEIDPKNPSIVVRRHGLWRALENGQSRHHVRPRSFRASASSKRSPFAASLSIRRTRT